MSTLVREIERAHIGPQELLRFLQEEPRQLDRSEPWGRGHRDWAILEELDFVNKIIPGAYGLFRAEGHQMPIEGGSFITGTSAEVLFASITTGTQLVSFTTEDNLLKTIPNMILPAGFFYNLGAAGKSLKLKANMRIGATATPTFTFTVRLLTSATWSAAGVAWATAAITVAASTLAPAFLELDIIARALVQGATGLTLAGMGEVRAGALIATAGGVFSIPASNTAFTVTVDNTVTQYAFISVTCSASSASNLAQCEMVKLYGEN